MTKEKMMVKVKTFTAEIKIFNTRKELEQLDTTVSNFLSGAGVKRVISVSDCSTTDNTGATIGLIRSVAYETD